MSAFQPILGILGGTVAPSSFVKLSTAADNTYLQCGAAGLVAGVSQVGMRNVPGLLGSDILVAGNVGDEIAIFPPLSVCLIHFAGTVGAGAFVKSDASGFAVAASSGDVCGGITIQAGAAGTFGEIFVLPPGTKMP